MAVLKKTQNAVLGRQKLEGLTSEERRELVGALFFEGDKDRMVRFWLLMSLAVIIATFGLLANSTAVVIGAMLLSPLMTPTMGVSVSMVMAWPRRLVWSGLLLIAATGAAIAIGWLLVELSPQEQMKVLPSEVLARTSPKITDLIIALAAGTAGAIASIRKDVSAAIPGVAIAVAMVPPLATVGILLGVGDFDLAMKAMLLYLTNIVAIILAASLVFIFTGFVPRHRLRTHRGQVLIGLSVTALAVAVIAIPLYHAVSIAVDEAQVTSAANEILDEWLGGRQLRVEEVNLTSESAEVVLVGVDDPPAVEDLAAMVRDRNGEPIDIRVIWFKGEEQEITIEQQR